jgi:acyl carrier protein
MSKADAIAAIVRDISPAMAIGAEKYGESLFKLGIDSLDHASILLAVEEKFGVKIPDEAAEKLVTIVAIADFVAAGAPNAGNA